MEGIIKILALEDRLADFELSKRQVIRKLPNVLFTRAANEEEFLTKLQQASYDLIIADYHLPDYNGLTALLYVKEHYPELPFIFLTGALNNEEAAATAILDGANGYVLKDNIASLHQHITKVLTASQNKMKLRKARQAMETARNLKLQKAVALLSRSDDFGGKEEVVALISSLLPQAQAQGVR